MLTDYAIFASQENNPINIGDAAAFYMEGYNAAVKKKTLNNGLHWYGIRLCYNTNNGSRVFDIYHEIGVAEQSSIRKKRMLKKEFAPLHKYKLVQSHLLCNGTLSLEVVAYLGQF